MPRLRQDRCIDCDTEGVVLPHGQSDFSTTSSSPGLLTGCDGYVYCEGCYQDNDMAVCHGCNYSESSSSMTELYESVNGSVRVCNHCRQNIIRPCTDCGAEIDTRADSYEMVNNECVCSPCYEDRRVECVECSEQLSSHDSRLAPSGGALCDTCFDEVCCNCYTCSRVCWRNETTGVNGNRHCTRCMRQAEWNDNGFYTETPTYDEIGSQRRFGVEFETSSCPNHISIRGDTVFGCKPDGSVDGMEFVSPILYADQGFDEIRKLCGQARENNWRVNSACGFHLHLDMSNESPQNCIKVAMAYHLTYEFWTHFVSNSRKNNYYCAQHLYNSASFVGYDRTSRTFTDWIHNLAGEKYTWVNWQSYLRHQTVELRNHSATLNATKVCNWVKAHARFIDKIVTMTKVDILNELSGKSTYDQFKAISEWWDCDDLTEFYKNRAASFNKPFRSEISLVTS